MNSSENQTKYVDIVSEGARYRVPLKDEYLIDGPVPAIHGILTNRS